MIVSFFFFFQAEDGIRDDLVTGVQTCALPISMVHVRLGRVVFGVGDPKAGAAGGVLNLLQFPSLNHQCEITSGVREDRKSTRLNSSHQIISYAVFCLKKKKKQR